MGGVCHVLCVPVVYQVPVYTWVCHAHLSKHVLLYQPLPEALVSVVEHVVTARDHIAAIMPVLSPTALGVEEVGAQRLVQPWVELTARHGAVGTKFDPPTVVLRVFDLFSELHKVSVGLENQTNQTKKKQT